MDTIKDNIMTNIQENLEKSASTGVAAVIEKIRVITEDKNNRPYIMGNCNDWELDNLLI
jgi:hypothetical protein